MVENYPIKIDESGRIVIPGKVRNMYNITKGTILKIKPEKEKIKVTKYSSINIESIKQKLINLENLHPEIKFSLSANKRIYYESINIEKKNYYYFETKSKNYIKIKIKVFYDNEKIAKTILELLKISIEE